MSRRARERRVTEPRATRSTRAAKWSRPRDLVLSLYSERSVTAGSARIACRAGSQLASKAAIMMVEAVAAIVKGSNGRTSNNWLWMKRPNRIAAAIPNNTPVPARRRPWPTTSPSTAALSAPRAMRIPISRVRCMTAYARTPKRPSAASSRAAAARKLRIRIAKRLGASESVKRASIGLMSYTGKFGSAPWTASRMAATVLDKSPHVFTRMFPSASGAGTG